VATKGSQPSPYFSNDYGDLHFLRVWNTWNNFDRFDLRQIESESDSISNIRTVFRVFRHLNVSIGDGLPHHFTVARLGVARPILHEGGRHPARFKVGNTEPVEAVEAKFHLEEPQLAEEPLSRERRD